MNITWHGQYTVKIVSKDTTVIFDPYDTSTGLAPFRGKADVLALTNPSDVSMSNVSGIQGDPILVKNPGEYSIQGMTIQATSWLADDNTERSIHLWNIEGITLLHLGALNRDLTDEEFQTIEKNDIDIFLVPVGGGSGLDTKQALQLVSKIEPRIIIPIHYKLPKLKEKLDSVEQFAKEMGNSTKEKKLSIRASKLPQDDVETIILTP